MKKVIIILACIIALGIGYFFFGGSVQQSLAQSATPQAKPTLPAVKAETKIVSEGKVVPAADAALGFAAGGTVIEVLVAEGARVEANQALVRLDSRQQTAAVAQSEAALRRAQAQLAQLKAGARPQEIAVAEASLASAQAALQKLQQGPDEQQLIAARAEVANAEAQLRQAQAAYDRAGGASNPSAAMLPSSLQLEQATNACVAAQARLNSLQKGPTAADIASAQAEIRRAQAQLDLIKAGTRPEAIAAAESEVAASQAALDQTKTALANTELRAPFAGTAAVIDANVGEQVGGGTPIVKLADCSAWLVETTDLTELNVVRVREGARASVEFDALPGVQLPGVVSRIRLLGENRQGDIVYTVLVKPLQSDERLRWNMTATVSIEPTP